MSWDEADHPRDEQGQFASGGGGIGGALSAMVSSAAPKGQSAGGHVFLSGKSETAKVHFGASTLKGLPKHEALEASKSARAYTGQNGATVNEKIRSGAQLTPREERIKTGLDKYLAHAPKVSGDMELHRGMQVTSTDNIHVGMVIPSRGFMSTSSNEKKAKEFATDAGMKSVLMKITSHKSGVSMTHFSKFPDEKEVIFPRGSRFEVTQIEPHPKGVVLHVKEVEPKNPEQIRIKKSQPPKAA